MTNEPRIIRTMGFAPAHDPEKVIAAADSGLDAVGFDFEDLTPRAEKQRARELFPEVARELVARGTIVMARTNDVGRGCEEDMAAIVSPELHCACVPKARSAQQVAEFCRLLEQAEVANSLPVGTTLVRPVIETAEGIRNAYEVARASTRVTYMGGVSGGYWGDLGATVGSIIGDGTESLYLRSKVLVDARAAGVRFPIGGGSISPANADTVREFAWQNKRLGYTGQYAGANAEMVAIINEVYTPTPHEIEEWKSVLSVLEEAEREGAVCVWVGERMYDTAGMARAREQLDLARRLGLTD